MAGHLGGAAAEAALLGRRQGGQRDEVAGEGAQELGLLLRHPTLIELQANLREPRLKLYTLTLQWQRLRCHFLNLSLTFVQRKHKKYTLHFSSFQSLEIK